MSAWKAGEVVWFDEENGKGMIIDLEDGESFFVDYSTIESTKKYKKLRKGKKVEYKTRQTKYANVLTKVKEVNC